MDKDEWEDEEFSFDGETWKGKERRENKEEKIIWACELCLNGEDNGKRNSVIAYNGENFFLLRKKDRFVGVITTPDSLNKNDKWILEFFSK